MKLRTIAWLFVGVTALTACTNPQNGSSGTPTPAVSPVQGDRTRPASRVLPINVEGEVKEIELKLFDQPPLPFTTYVPTKDFTNEVGSSEEGTAVRFYFSPKGVKDDKAYIHIFLPAQDTKVGDVRDLILGDGGLLASNGWQLVDRTDIVSYSWAREKLIYQQGTAKETFVGAVYIGEQDDKAFYAFTRYPAEYGDGFEPRATIVLESLQFREQK